MTLNMALYMIQVLDLYGGLNYCLPFLHSLWLSCIAIKGNTQISLRRYNLTFSLNRWMANFLSICSQYILLIWIVLGFTVEMSCREGKDSNHFWILSWFKWCCCSLSEGEAALWQASESEARQMIRCAILHVRPWSLLHFSCRFRTPHLELSVIISLVWGFNISLFVPHMPDAKASS